MEKGNNLFHKLDRYVGIPIVFLLGLLFKNRSRTLPSRLQRFALLNIGSIGDSVLMSAPIRDLRLNFPNAEIIVFTGSTNFHLVSQIENIDAIVKLPITNPIKTIATLKKHNVFDLLFDFGPWPRLNSIYSFFVPARFRIGFNSKNQFRHYVYDQAIKHSNQLHEIENYRSLISAVVSPSKSIPSIRNNGTAVSKKIIQASENYCIVHPWPGGYKSYMKEWSIYNWAQLIGLLSKDFDKIIVTGAPVDKEKSDSLVSQVKLDKSAHDKIISAAGNTSLDETIDLIANSKIVFSVNTGIAHIAASFDVNQICLHGPTNVKRWGPLSSRTINVVPSSGKFGYLNFGFEYELSNGNCMDNISVESVYKTYLNLTLHNK